MRVGADADTDTVVVPLSRCHAPRDSTGLEQGTRPTKLPLFTVDEAGTGLGHISGSDLKHVFNFPRTA